jgi:aminoglycoside/choline kinase family phosphotransferase
LGSEIVLTSEQRAFIARHIADYSELNWDISLAGRAGSARTFMRIREMVGRQRAFILVVWDAGDEDWQRFIAIAAEVAPQAPFLPRIHAWDAKSGLILEEDVGTTTLRRFVDESADKEKTVEEMYCRVLDELCVWQSLDIKASPAVASRVMDRETLLGETGYFAEHCVGAACGCGRALNGAWESERQALAAAAAALPVTFLHRDFQSENILLTKNGIRFVDFQGARLGPPAYDVASLLFDPYVSFLTVECADRLFEYYRSLELPVKVGRRDFDLCAAQRLMQACGAYGNLSFNKGKKRYRKFIPLALDRLTNVIERLPEYPEIKKVVACCREAAGKER